MVEEDVKFFLQPCELKTMIDVAVSNVMTLTAKRIISALQLGAAESRPALIGDAISTAIATVFDKHAGEIVMFEFVKDALSQAVTRQDEVLAIAYELIVCDRVMELIA